jgi:hypothetical protein
MNKDKMRERKEIEEQLSELLERTLRLENELDMIGFKGD